MVKSEFEISCIFPSRHSTFDAINLVTFPFLPSKDLVAIDQSLSQPSSWELVVLILSGQ